jgi:nickel-dependent lactate racemase
VVLEEATVKEATLPYGTRAVPLSVPGGRLVRRMTPHTPPPASSPKDLLATALRQPIGSARLSEIARGKRSAAILIPGKARVAGTRDYVAALIAELNAAGMPNEGITVFLADGTHEQHLHSDIEALLGTELAARVRCLGHDCRRDEVVELGTTSYGTPVLFNRRVLESEVKVLTGRIVPHYFAGFSGGRKALVPGVAGFPTILANHKLTLDPIRGIHPDVRLCSLRQNPVHLDMLEGARLAQPDFCLNTLMDAEDRMVSVVAGDSEAAHEEGCRQALDMLRVVLKEPVDVLISSAGGSPYDDNFMQSLKAVFNVQEVVRPGGTILWVAECSRGINPGFLSWASVESDTELEQGVRERYALTGHNSLMLRHLIRRVEVALWSGLAPDTVRRLGLNPVASLEEGLAWIRQRHPRGFSYAVVPHANIMCAALEAVGVLETDKQETLGHVA